MARRINGIASVESPLLHVRHRHHVQPDEKVGIDLDALLAFGERLLVIAQQEVHPSGAAVDQRRERVGVLRFLDRPSASLRLLVKRQQPGVVEVGQRVQSCRSSMARLNAASARAPVPVGAEGDEPQRRVRFRQRRVDARAPCRPPPWPSRRPRAAASAHRVRETRTTSACPANASAFCGS